MIEHLPLSGVEVFYDPFAEENNTLSHLDVFASIVQRYADKVVEHDYTADNFVKDTESLLLDAQFKEQFITMNTIVSNMHQLCGDDHLLQNALQSSAVFTSSEHSSHDGHNHANAMADDEDETTGKKNKKSKHAQRKEVRAAKKYTFDELVQMFLRKKALPKKP